MVFNKTVLAMGAVYGGMFLAGAYQTATVPWYLAPLAAVTTAAAARMLYHVGAAAREVNDSPRVRASFLANAVAEAFRIPKPDLELSKAFLVRVHERVGQDCEWVMGIAQQVLSLPILQPVREFYGQFI